MAEFTAAYTANFGSEVSFARQPSATLNGPDNSIPDYALIRSLFFSVYCGVSNYNADLSVGFTISDTNGNTVSIPGVVSTGSSNRIWAEWGGEPGSDLDWNNLSSISLYGTSQLTIRPNYTATLYIGFDNPSAPTPPTTVKVTPASVASGTAVLSWSGAQAGNANAIAGYQVYRATAAGGSYSHLADVSGTSLTVDSPYSNGESYYYKIKTLGVISGIDSDLSSVYGTLKTEWSAPSAPSGLSLSANNVGPETSVTLRWNAASGGTNNPIKHYAVYRANDSDGYYSQIGTTAGTSLNIVSHRNNGEVYFYKVKSIGTISGSDSELSSYVALTTYWTAPTPPATLALSANNVGPETTVTLQWSGAAAGTNNPITKYEVYRATAADGYFSKLGETTGTSLSVVSPSGNGAAYYYKVKAVGQLSGDSQQSTATAILTTLWTAPGMASSISLSVAKSRPSKTVTLSWSAAAAGTNNPVRGYEIHRANTADGMYSKIGETTGTNFSVTSPAENNASFFYKVRTLGKLSNAELSTQTAQLQTMYTPVGTPGQPSLAENNVSPGKFVTLTWAASVAGINNNVQSYQLYRSVDGGAYALITTATDTRASVAAPTVNGMAYTFAIKAIGEYGSAYDSDLSPASGELFCYFTAPSAPQNLRINNDTFIFLAAGAPARLTWSAASGGTNNPLVSYQIICDGVQVGETTELFFDVSASFRYGQTQQYTVKTRGAYSSSQESNAVNVTTNIPPSPPKSTESVSEFMFFDKNDTLLFFRGDAITLSIVEEEFRINGSFPFDADHQLLNGMRIGWMETDQFQMFELRQVSTDAVSMIQTFEGEHVGMAELLDAPIEDVRPYGVTAETAAIRALENTGWTVGFVTTGTEIKSTNYYYESAWSALLKVRDTWGVAVVPRMMYTYNGLERFVDVLDRRGQNRGVRLTLDINAQQAGVTYDDRELYTALYGRGSSTGEGERLLTMADAYWSIDNGDPANKPEGQEWIEDTAATAVWGRKGRKRTGFVKFETLDPFELTRLTWDALQVCKTPKITIDMTAFDLSALGYSYQGISLGDDIVAILDPIGLEVQTRVVQNTRDVLRAENSNPVIGSYRPDLIYKIKGDAT